MGLSLSADEFPFNLYNYFSKNLVVCSEIDVDFFFLQLSLRHDDPEIAAHWATLVGGSVPTRGRPRRLLVFINPHGGRGQAPALFYNTILPLFSLAGIESKVR
jgi:hypothetical protein